MKYLAYIPWTGLGLYNGYRGDRWLANRIRVFKQFVVPSLQAQTHKDFTIWMSWRREEKTNPQVKELNEYLINLGFSVISTYAGILFWDDKYPDEEAHIRLVNSLQFSLGELVDVIGQEDVIMHIQPSDDCYASDTFWRTNRHFENNPDCQAVGYRKGYIMDYKTLELKEYNPETSPPFYAIRFPRDTFIDPLKHLQYTGPYHSHEYVPKFLKMDYFPERGFIVGTHLDNISTVFDHPYAQSSVDPSVINDFGLGQVKKLEIPFSIRRILFHKMPYKLKRKLRYLAGEKKWILRPLFALVYNFLRS